MILGKKQPEFDSSLLYDYDAINKTYVLNIALKSFKELYNNWDYSPQRKRDINENLIRYIEECSVEIPIKRKVAIHLYLPAGKSDETREKEGRLALKSYFDYLRYKKIQQKNKYMKNASMYGLSGILLLSLAYFLQSLSLEKYYVPILPEGLFIGGWVLFWEVFSIIFFRVSEIKKSIREYNRLRESEITYHFGRVFPLVIRND